MIYGLEIRNVKSNDLDAIMRVENEAWPIEARAPKEKFEERLKVFPNGFFIAVLNDEIVGVTTSQIIKYNPKNPPNSWTEITGDGHISESHNPNGKAVYVVSLGVSPKGRPEGKGIGVGTALLERQKQLTKELGKEYLVLSARVPSYDSFCKTRGNIPIEVYVNLRRNDGLPEDIELRFYERAGLKQVKICPNTMDDAESRNYGVMMEWKA
ncbi:GNAT family N-acetyltransferase [Candidatus Woesearchaeota archaeon]|nr:GNAT family N-acetyltransferase [Candidatus Woesearchaeota archaeon]